MERFDRVDAQTIRTEINDALEAIAKKYNSSVDLGNIKYGGNLEMKLTFSKMTEGIFGTYADTNETKAFKSMEYKHKIPADALHNEFTHKGEKIKIIGYKTSRPKYPISYEKDGRGFKCSADYMLRMVKADLPSVFL